MPENIIIYLDFDGVLHPCDVSIVGKTPVLLTPDLNLFCWSPILESLINEYDPTNTKIKIVLSTSWVSLWGLEHAVSYLPDNLRNRVIGKTKKVGRTRAVEVIMHAIDNKFENWFALDDLFSGEQDWPEDQAEHIVLCDPDLGLSDAKVTQLLRKLLSDHCKCI
jgi:hypothetical protein